MTSTRASALSASAASRSARISTRLKCGVSSAWQLMTMWVLPLRTSAIARSRYSMITVSVGQAAPGDEADAVGIGDHERPLGTAAMVLASHRDGGVLLPAEGPGPLHVPVVPPRQ